MTVAESIFDLSGRVAIVTGGGHGIGRSFVQGLAEHGADVAVLDLDLERAEAVAESARESTGRRVIPVQADVSSEADVERAVAAVVEQLGGLHVLVNNAGLWSHVPALELGIDEWRRVIDVNLTGTLLCCLTAGRVMVEQGLGSIVNIASISGELGFKERAAYAASKHGVRGLTKSLANEWATAGVRVNAIGPGSHKMGMAPKWSKEPGVLKNEILGNIPMGRLGEPDELIGALVFLASDASSYITGQTVFSDGGWLLE